MDQLEVLMLEYPIVRYIVIAMICARLVFKPIFTILAKYVELTVETEDNSKLAKIMESKWYKLTAFALDLTLSIKLVQRKK
jgi:hypothetical protein